MADVFGARVIRCRRRGAFCRSHLVFHTSTSLFVASLAMCGISLRLFPWWGWLGVIWTTVAWILAWNRFAWFGACNSIRSRLCGSVTL